MKLLGRYSSHLYGVELPYNFEIQQNDPGHVIKILI